MSDPIKLVFREEGTDPRANSLVRTMLKAGYEISANDAERAWLDYSDTYAAGWIAAADEDEVVGAILSRCDEVPE